MDLGWDLRHRQTTGTVNPHPASSGTQSPGIGSPILFTSGQFAGRRIRFELQELQKAESGRKKVSSHPIFLWSVSDILYTGMRKWTADHWIRPPPSFCVYLSHDPMRRGNGSESWRTSNMYPFFGLTSTLNLFSQHRAEPWLHVQCRFVSGTRYCISTTTTWFPITARVFECGIPSNLNE